MKNFSHKMCRRYGVRLCQSDKCPVTRRNYPPGMHGPKGKKRLTEYGTQMAEKQKAKILYHISEKQFSGYYNRAIKQRGDTSEFLIQMLEMRFDNVVYRAGLAKTRFQARQMVNHGFFLINGKKNNIPSCQVKIKDEITFNPQKTKTKLLTERQNALKKFETPSWLHLDPKEFKVKVLNKPSPTEAEQAFDPRLIVEFYSR